MQLVIDNIYQRAFVERNNGNNRNLQLIEYLKHSEVMLLPTFLENSELQQVVLLYFQEKFGILEVTIPSTSETISINTMNNNTRTIDMFRSRDMFIQNPEQLKYFFRHAPAFAESHILQLVGFGDPKNPFALLFELPKYLKERKDKKEKKKSKSNSNSNNNNNASTAGDGSMMSIDNSEMGEDDINNLFSDNVMNQVTSEEFFQNIEQLRFDYFIPNSLEIWMASLNHINLISLKCSMIVLKKFLHGPLLIALPHLLPWCYFIISILLKREGLTHEDSKIFWIGILKTIFPWNDIINFLNVLLRYTLDNIGLPTPSAVNDTKQKDMNVFILDLCNKYSTMGFADLLQHFNENEDLPEVWKCWGTLWFDTISNKNGMDADSFENLGIKDHMFLDFPIDGIGYVLEDETGENFWKRTLRIIFLFKGIAENFDSLGLKVSYNAGTEYRNNNVPMDNILKMFSFKWAGSNADYVDANLGDELEIYTNTIINRITEFVDIKEPIHETNLNFEIPPLKSMIANEDIFDYTGYKKLEPNSRSFDKNGEFSSGSIYTAWPMDYDQLILAQNNNNNTNATDEMTDLFTGTLSIDELSFRQLKRPEFRDKSTLLSSTSTEPFNRYKTYFVFDATSWLRHFAHIYKLASNHVLKFAVCLTTFQELRFLRKSKDANVVEASTRAIITMRQLYSDGNLLPLRFTGNVATDIEEHLEFEEQITWRSHVDEFVIEAVMKAQEKFVKSKTVENMEGTSNWGEIDATTTTVSAEEEEKSNLFKYVVLITDDDSMRMKAQLKGISTFGTQVVFSVCSMMGIDEGVCTN